MEYQVCKSYRNQNTEFIYRNHHARRPCLQRPVIAQPGTPCRKSGEYQKDPALFIYASYRILFFSNKHNNPCHDQYNDCTDGRSQIGINPFNANLAEYGSQTRKNSRSKSVNKPFAILLPGAFRFLLFNHQKCSRGDQNDGCSLNPCNPFLQKNNR